MTPTEHIEAALGELVPARVGTWIPAIRARAHLKAALNAIEEEAWQAHMEAADVDFMAGEQ